MSEKAEVLVVYSYLRRHVTGAANGNVTVKGIKADVNQLSSFKQAVKMAMDTSPNGKIDVEKGILIPP